jgi:hypothetical protein
MTEKCFKCGSECEASREYLQCDFCFAQVHEDCYFEVDDDEEEPIVDEQDVTCYECDKAMKDLGSTPCKTGTY